ncbi:hypothetical protein HY546_03630 [archaeon]|nr:hypothetical protein [archaeon]
MSPKLFKAFPSVVVLVLVLALIGLSQSAKALEDRNIQLKAGLQMISIPFLTDDMVSQMAGEITLWRWDPESEQWQKNPSIFPGESYYLDVSEDIKLSLTGISLEQASNWKVAIHPGWNMIGLPFDNSVSRLQIGFGFEGGVYNLTDAVQGGLISSIIYWFDNSTQDFRWLSLPEDLPFGELDPWKGYILWSETDADLVFLPSQIGTSTEFSRASSGAGPRDRTRGSTNPSKGSGGPGNIPTPPNTGKPPSGGQQPTKSTPAPTPPSIVVRPPSSNPPTSTSPTNPTSPTRKIPDPPVDILETGFSPSKLSFGVGEAITWTNKDRTPHWVISEDGMIYSGELQLGETFTFAFPEPGQSRFLDVSKRPPYKTLDVVVFAVDREKENVAISYDTNINGYLDTDEINRITRDWSSGKLQDAQYFMLLDCWRESTPVSACTTASAASVRTSGGKARAFSATMKDAFNYEFKANGYGIAAIEVDVFDLTGKRVFTASSNGNRVMWAFSKGLQPVAANGVYLYVVTATGIDGKVLRSAVNKLVLVR